MAQEDEVFEGSVLCHEHDNVLNADGNCSDDCNIASEEDVRGDFGTDKDDASSTLDGESDNVCREIKEII